MEATHGLAAILRDAALCGARAPLRARLLRPYVPLQSGGDSPSMRVRGLAGWSGQSLTQGGRVMGDYSEAFIGIDTSKLRNAVAIADAGRGGEVRFLGEIENTSAATAKLVRKLAAKYERLTFCYEAGPTGYGLHRQIKGLGFECAVVAPSLITKRRGDKVKTNRRDALSLAKLLRADELTAVLGAGRRSRGDARSDAG